jgi:hypothetical protein
MREVVSFIAGKILDYVPAFLLRLFFRPSRLAGRIHIGMREEKPICPNLDKQVPEISIYSTITNLTNLKLTLDRLLIDLWFGQPTIRGCVLKRYLLSPASVSEIVSYRTHLTQAQCHQIADYLEDPDSHGAMHLYVTGYFESKAGIIEVERDIERRSV